MTDRIKLQRLDGTPWGFRLTGGLDFGTPITVIKVTGGSIAAEAGIQVGDIVVEINGKSTKQLTHTEAQNWIVRCGNLIYFNVIRGSVLTPPSTPLRGMTPVTSEHSEYYDVNDNYSDGTCYNDGSLRMEDGLTEREYTLLNGGEVPRPFVGIKVPAGAVSDLELDELLTGNEEVLDQGILGINFQKYFPQVDFIKHSEVFKVLQDENTHKELPEQVQLKIDPDKRFSTFLQKPKGPSTPKKEDTHSVLWLFLAKEGKKVIDERWGTPEEERRNVSRNTNREDEGVIMPPLSNRNTPVPFFDSYTDRFSQSTKSKDIFTEDIKSALSNIADSNKVKRSCEQKETELEGKNETELDSESMEVEQTLQAEYEVDIAEAEPIEETVGKLQSGGRNSKVVIAEISTDVDNWDEGDAVQFEEVINGTRSSEENLELQKAFVSRLSEIQQQILQLEGQAPRDLTSQLVEVQQQLNRILQLNKLSIQDDDVTLKEETTEQEIFLQADFEQSSSLSATSDSEYVVNYTINPYKKRAEAFDEYTVQIDNIDQQPSLTVRDDKEDSSFERYEVGEFEICETTDEVIEEKPAPTPEPPKKPFHPLTPAPRPIVLPGGRQWRKPKDAAHDDFYQGVLVEQAEVLIGNNKGVNFKKYVPPKFDTDASPVCKLIRELETKTDASERKPEAEYYQSPLTKRHFYNATLPQPPPVGLVELRDLF